MQLDLASLLLIITCLQVLFLLFSLGSIASSNRRARALLIGVMLLLLWYQVEFLAIRGPMDSSFNLLFGTRYGSWLAMGPMIYLYTAVSLNPQFELRWKAFLHFAPFLLFALSIPLMKDGLITNRASDYGILTVFDDWNREPITPFQYLYGFIVFGQFVYVGGYSALSLRLIRQTRTTLKDEYSNVELDAFRWQRVFHWSAIIIVTLIGAYVLYQFQTREYRRHTDYLFVIPLSLAVYLLTYQALRYPQLFFMRKEDETGRYKKSSLSPAVAEAYLNKLKRALEEEEVYTQRELRLSDLADHLDVSPHHLSQVINESLQQNFFDLINQYRVEAAKERITRDGNKSLLQIAFEVGFNNKTSFNNAFKRHVGMTPSQFKKSA